MLLTVGVIGGVQPLQPPPEEKVDAATLTGLGIATAEIAGLKTVSDLLTKYRPLRNAIAHFFIDDSVAWEEKIPTPISNGDVIRTFSAASSAVKEKLQSSRVDRAVWR
jgi:hypothetical protein